MKCLLRRYFSTIKTLKCLQVEHSNLKDEYESLLSETIELRRRCNSAEKIVASHDGKQAQLKRSLDIERDRRGRYYVEMQRLRVQVRM